MYSSIIHTISGQPFGCPLTFLNNRSLFRLPAIYGRHTRHLRDDRETRLDGHREQNLNNRIFYAIVSFLPIFFSIPAAKYTFLLKTCGRACVYEKFLVPLQRFLCDREFDNKQNH